MARRAEEVVSDAETVRDGEEKGSLERIVGNGGLQDVIAKGGEG